jgi:hypothetical protein
MGKRGPVALWSPKPLLPYCFFTVCGGLAWVATPTGNMGSAVRRCSTFVRIKRGFGYTQVLIGSGYEHFFGMGGGWDYLTEENAEASVSLLPELLRRAAALRNEIARVV